ncbi:MAG TPA: GNAT family N-acetyltransferase [Nocardioidaceae bacterium]
MTLLSTIETYYDAAPRPTARVEEVGPFTLFLRRSEHGWPFYARPALGVDLPLTAAHVEQLRSRQRLLGVPENLEWVHETTPTLLAAARQAGLQVAECPLLVLPQGAAPVIPPLRDGLRVAVLAPDSPDLAATVAAVAAGFADTDTLEERPAEPLPELMREGLLAMAAAYDDRGVVGGGSHSPRGETTELAGIAVLPRARRQGVGAALTAALVADARQRGAVTVFLSARDDTVARVYERIGFQRVGTACVAEPPEAATHS